MATPRFRHVLSPYHYPLDAAAKSRPDAKPLKEPSRQRPWSGLEPA